MILRIKHHGSSTSKMTNNIHHITPYHYALGKINIGGYYNSVIDALPDDSVIVLRDQDTLILNPNDFNKQLYYIISPFVMDSYDLLTCMTNRIGLKDHCVPGMFEEESISRHIEKASELRSEFGHKIVETSVAPGMLMIFHKITWARHKFEENSIFFDRIFSKKVIQSGGKIGLCKGMYLLHLYRWGQINPEQYTEHLKQKL